MVNNLFLPVNLWAGKYIVHLSLFVAENEIMLYSNYIILFISEIIIKYVYNFEYSGGLLHFNIILKLFKITYINV